MVRENLANVQNRIRAAAERAGRNPDGIKLIAVTKEAGAEAIEEAASAGVRDIGENRVKDALLKKNALDSRFRDLSLNWHMIGHLQSNKAKEAVRIFSLIHSVDSIKLVYKLNDEAGKIGKKQDILIEVNTSGESSKFGIKCDFLGGFLKEITHLAHINVLGLMTMAPLADDAETVRPYFRKLKKLADEYGLREISMGMTQDFEVAVEEGATMVRIGRAIFRG